MGLDINCFVNCKKIGDEFICSICRDVVHQPKQINAICEHIFCFKCISYLVEKQEVLTCPNDRNPINEPYLKKVSLYWLNNYSKLKIKCFFSKNGCKTALCLEDIDKHEKSCEHNPNVMIICKEGCGAQIPRAEFNKHKCIAHLKGLIEELSLSKPQSQINASIFDEMRSIKNEINEIKKKLDETIERLNESVPQKMYAIAKKISPDINKLLLDNDTIENSAPEIPPRRFDSSLF